MTHDTLQTILSIGETVSVEFKRGGNGAEADTFETICAFLNRFGGDVFLGVLDDGSVVGVPPAAAPQIANHIVNIAGNPGVFQPASEIIAAFFREIGLADQLGSGVRNLYKYARAYGGVDPEIVENDTFRISVNIPDEASEQLVSSDQKVVADGEKLVSTSKKLVFDGKKLVFDGRAFANSAPFKTNLGKDNCPLLSRNGYIRHPRDSGSVPYVAKRGHPIAAASSGSRIDHARPFVKARKIPVCP